MAVKKRQKTLAHGRPPASKPKVRMTSERSRTIIRTHHRLQKAHAAALKKGNAKEAKIITQELKKNGGIKTYQAASKQGQAKDRGGDSSKLLVDWLQQERIIHLQGKDSGDSNKDPLRCLEVGALSTKNVISKIPAILNMTRIDLNSQGPGIEKQDFMEREVPTNDEQRFDIISLSLVLNYVPEAVGRGEMLKRTTKFLRVSTALSDNSTLVLPALFLVLPLACINNSRYFDEELLLQIMANMGFILRYSKHTPKLCYYLLTLTSRLTPPKTEKKKIRDGPGMNNFCVVVR